MNNLIVPLSDMMGVGFGGSVLDLSSYFVQGFIIHAISALFLFYIIGKILFNPVREVLKKRREGIASEYSNIEEEKTEVSKLKSEYEGKLTNIENERTEILEHARKVALKQEGKILKDAKEEAEKMKETAKLEIEREKAAVKDEIRKEIIEVATMMASKFVAASIDDKIRVSLLEETLDEMGEDTWLN